MAVHRNHKPTRVYLNDLDITEHVRGYSLITTDYVDITIHAQDLADLADFIKKQVGATSPRFTNIEWEVPYSAERSGVLLEGSAFFNDGSTESFNVLGIGTNSADGGGFIFYCDIPPHLPDGLVYYNGEPVSFRQGKRW